MHELKRLERQNDNEHM